MHPDVSGCNTYNYGDALYWDFRYFLEAGGAFDCYVGGHGQGCGYEDIMNIDISSVAIDMMRRKYEYIPQLKYMQTDVRDMSLFPDESFDSVIDKDAPISASRMRGEVSRLLKPGGIYMLITYGDPSVRMPHLSCPAYNWTIVLYNLPRPDCKRPGGCSSTKSYLELIPVTEKG